MRSTPKKNKEALKIFNEEMLELLKKHKVTLYTEDEDGSENFSIRCYSSAKFDSIIASKDEGGYH